MELYIKDPYLKETEATIIFSQNNIVELDVNIFYPISGGQPNDLGRIDDANVLDVKKENGKILIKLDKTLEKGKKVICILDWQRRYKLMRMHTAAHLLSAIIHKETSALITGNQLGIEKSRIDFNLDNFDREQIKSFEDKANSMIDKEIEVRSYVVSREELDKNPNLIKLAKGLLESIKEVRIVEIEGFDAQPCAGTHIKNIKEIGRIKIIDAENKGKNNRRIYFKLD